MMKPAWHEVVASLETQVARRRSTRPLEADRPAPAPPADVRDAASQPEPESAPAPSPDAEPAPRAERPRQRASDTALATPAAETVGESWAPPVLFEPGTFERDPLTGRPDRRALMARLADAVSRRDGSSWALVVLDIDNFRAFNYELGCAAGDALLRGAADRLAATVRHADIVCRFGSDEFAVLVGDASPGSITPMVDRLLQAVARPLTVNGLAVCPQASAGVTLVRDTHARAEDVVREAERALARARTLGGGRAVVHDAALEGRALALTDLEAALRRALDTEEFRTHYQPIVSVKGGQVAGFEVLLWRRSAGSRRGI